MHEVDTNWPEQVLQPVHDAALVVVENVEPEVQEGQTVSAVAEQTTLRYFPAAQTVQVAGADEPARQKLPAGQAI